MTSSSQTPPTSQPKKSSNGTATLVVRLTNRTLLPTMQTRPLSNHPPKPPMATAALPHPGLPLQSSLTSTRTLMKQPTLGPKTQVCGMFKDKPRVRPPILVQVITAQLRHSTTNSISRILKVHTTGVEEAVRARLVLVLARVPTLMAVGILAGVGMFRLEVLCSRLDLATVNRSIFNCILLYDEKDVISLLHHQHTPKPHSSCASRLPAQRSPSGVIRPFYHEIRPIRTYSASEHAGAEGLSRPASV